MALVEIPLSPAGQSFSVTLSAKTYRMRLDFIDGAEGGWTLDLGDADGTPLACGIPLLPGQDLLEPYEYLGFGGSLFINTPGDPDAVPTFEGLGTATKLYFGTLPQSDTFR